MSSSNFNSGINLSKLNDEEFVWLRTGRIQNRGKREKFMEANKTQTLVSLITTHAKGILLQVFAKYYAVKVHLGFCIRRSGIEVGFSGYYSFCLSST